MFRSFTCSKVFICFHLRESVVSLSKIRNSIHREGIIRMLRFLTERPCAVVKCQTVDILIN